jgi:hypothetical protein
MAVYQGPFEVVRLLIEAAVEFDKALTLEQHHCMSQANH